MGLFERVSSECVMQYAVVDEMENGYVVLVQIFVNVLFFFSLMRSMYNLSASIHRNNQRIHEYGDVFEGPQ